MTIYDPQAALQRPVAIDITKPNFEDTKIHVRCVSDDDLPSGDADALCRRVATLFRNQGAETDTEVMRGPRYTPAEFDEVPDLIIELDSKVVSEERTPALTALSIISFTVIPDVAEETFEQNVIVRDADGSVLGSDRGRARFVTFIGVLLWGINWVADLFVRDDKDELTGDRAKENFSRDFYSLISQAAFNARVRQRLMAAPLVPTPSPASSAPPPAPLPVTRPSATPPPLKATPPPLPSTTLPGLPPTPTPPPQTGDPADGGE